MIFRSNAGSAKFIAEQERRASSLDVARTPYEIERETRLREREGRESKREELGRAVPVKSARPPSKQPKSLAWPARLNAIASNLGTTADRIAGRDRDKAMQEKRRLAFWCLRSCGSTEVKIAGWLGRSPTTIADAVTRVSDRRRRDPEYQLYTDSLLKIARAATAE